MDVELLDHLTNIDAENRLSRARSSLAALEAVAGARILSVEGRILLFCSIAPFACSELILLTKSSYVTVHAALRNLVARGLIEAVQGADDRRNVFYERTARVDEFHRQFGDLADFYRGPVSAR
jgi:DNA-binding MarR family transcriptional regulator